MLRKLSISKCSASNSCWLVEAFIHSGGVCTLSGRFDNPGEVPAANRVRPPSPSHFLVRATVDAPASLREPDALELCDSALSTDDAQASSKMKDVEEGEERAAESTRPASPASRSQTPGYIYAIAAAPSVSRTTSGRLGSSAPPPSGLPRASSRGHLATPKGTQVLIDKDSILLTGVTTPLSQLSLIDPWMEKDESDRVCAVCLERQPDVGIGGCEHRLCGTCAQEMCSRVTDKPLACP
jgi:hypothetical protein